ncbi:MAG: MFS transporter, partial [Anaerolineae bacterium]|nr:MFS transporter [Anaerolineae bacterium]
SLDNRWRARYFGLQTAISGLILLVVAPRIGTLLNSEQVAFPQNYGILFAISGGLFILSIIPPLFLKELPSGAAGTSVPTFREFIPTLGRVLREDRPFSAMIVTRMLSSLFMMGAPFYIGFATIDLGLSSGVAVANLLQMQTLGTLIGALIYAWMGNRHNLLYIRIALLTASLLPISALLASRLGPIPLYIGFLAAGMALSNLFASYLNWVIMHVRPEQRAIHTGLFNTIAALTLLFAPVIGGTIAQTLGYQAVFVVALALILCAFFVVMRYIPNSETEPEPAPEAV